MAKTEAERREIQRRPTRLATPAEQSAFDARYGDLFQAELEVYIGENDGRPGAIWAATTNQEVLN